MSGWIQAAMQQNTIFYYENLLVYLYLFYKISQYNWEYTKKI